jgi:alpha-galactosidase
MGFSTWNTFGCDINETKILGVAEAMISSGLQDLGYNYINLDDW